VGVRTRVVIPIVAGAAVVALAACGGSSDDAAQPAAPAQPAQPAAPATTAADLTAVKDYLLEHTGQLTGFTADFAADAQRYYDLAEAANFDYEALWQSSAAEVGELVEHMKEDWVEGNPYYERMEGIVAGTPSLAEYDVIIDAGSSAAEDPASAVPFDLTLPDGRVLEQPGNFYNLTEGALWGTLPEALAAEVPSTPTDLDGDGTVEFGEVLPDAAFLNVAATEFQNAANDLAAAAEAWQPADSDAFTALVVMVPTMSEYFGQWKESRFVAGDSSSAESFNVVSRLSDIRDIITGLQVVYSGVGPLVANVDEAQSNQTGRELDELGAFIGDLYDQEQSGDRFTPEEADTLGSEAQDRATAIAGQVSQAAAELGISIEQ
jgi:Imelysin